MIQREPRRRWPRGEKLVAVAATLLPGVRLTDVARAPALPNLPDEVRGAALKQHAMRSKAGFVRIVTQSSIASAGLHTC